MYEAPTTLNLGSACCHSIQNVSYSHMSLENVRLEIYKADSSFVIVCGCEIWPVTPRKEQGLRVFENRVIMRLFVLRNIE